MWKIFELQPELQPYHSAIEERMWRLQSKKRDLLNGRSLRDYAVGHLWYGLHRTERGWVYREYAPHAEALHLIGDFNGWDRQSHPLRREGLDWVIELPELTPMSRYKVAVTANGETRDRIPLYARYVVQDDWTKDFSAAVWESHYEWHDADFDRRSVPPLIYEAHIGMATEDWRVGTYREFADKVLPRIRDGGYNTVQLMAVMEHPYYGSFGYHVSSFFAASSRFGTPDELKYLVDRAHSMGIRVLLDLVHSHSVKNTAEGIDLFDGTELFFKSGEAGCHRAWDSRVFDYGKSETLHFLLSDLQFWMTEYHLDGFRFDGVGSMLYRHHGLGVSFVSMDQYFDGNVDLDAVTYLQLATSLVRELDPDATLIAEDVSAMPGLCLPVEYGGVGFTHRLSMGLPDYYIKAIKEQPLGHWDMGKLMWELTAKRNGEARIAYAESHDQALVGDQTIIFRLAGSEMYTNMGRGSQSLVIDNAVAMHKLIRLLTLCAGGEGYLNFMGNEFGHPEWIDFPREGNGWSYQYARRQWSLADNEGLRYGQLGEFDRAMLWLFRERSVLSDGTVDCLRFHQDDQVLVLSRGGLIFAFNLHPTNSQTALFLPCEHRMRPVLSSDEPRFGGFGNADMRYVYDPVENDPLYGQGFRLYLPAMTAIVLEGC